MNEFDYKGWVGGILDNYTSTSEFPAEGSENTLYIVRDGGQAQLYVWDSETSAYIEFAGGGGGGGTDHGVPSGGTTGQVLAKASDTDYDVEWVDQSGGGGGADSWSFQPNANSQMINVSVAKNGGVYSGEISFLISAWRDGSGAPIGQIMGTETISGGDLTLRADDYPDISTVWDYINTITHYDFVFFTGTMENPTVCGFARWYNPQHKPYGQPSSDGTYVLQATVNDGDVTYSWVSA